MNKVQELEKYLVEMSKFEPHEYYEAQNIAYLLDNESNLPLVKPTVFNKMWYNWVVWCQHPADMLRFMNKGGVLRYVSGLHDINKYGLLEDIIDMIIELNDFIIHYVDPSYVFSEDELIIMHLTCLLSTLGVLDLLMPIKHDGTINYSSISSIDYSKDRAKMFLMDMGFSQYQKQIEYLMEKTKYDFTINFNTMKAMATTMNELGITTEQLYCIVGSYHVAKNLKAESDITLDYVLWADEFQKASFDCVLWADEFQIASPKRIITGDMLKLRGYKEGKELGNVLDKLFEAQLAGKFHDEQSGLKYLEDITC